MKKTLALVLAFALVFSTMTFAFADDAAISADAKLCADLGMLVGDGNGVTAAYTATAPTRIQSAIMFLRLKGLYEEAIKFAGTDNFADGNIAWAEGKNLLAYLKANPQLGWQGDGKNFNPNNPITAKEYYKVMLQGLGYVQSSATVAGGDFSWDNVIEFAATKGLTKSASVASFTINDVAVATVEALKGTMKEGGKTLAAALVEAGKIDKAKAVAAGVYTEVATTTAKLVKVLAVGNTKVMAEYDAAVDKAFAENVANYKVEGLEVKAAVLDGTKQVVLETAAQTSGKAYKLTVAGVAINFAGVAKDTAAPEIDTVEGTDTNRVVVTFTTAMDLATALDAANYKLDNNATVKSVAWDNHDDRDSVELTTDGLTVNKTYKVTVTNVKSVDAVVLKSASKNFVAKSDKKAPEISKVEAKTNTRILLTMKDDNELTKDSAENLANYKLTVGSSDTNTLDITAAKLVEDANDDLKAVELTTAPQKGSQKYVLHVNNLVDTSVLANKMTKEDTENVYGKRVDEDGPTIATNDVEYLSPTLIQITFTEDAGSRLDFATAQDLNNYSINNDVTIEKVAMKDAEDADCMTVRLTVSELGDNTSYKITVKNVADEFGNVMDDKTISKSYDKDTVVKVATISKIKSTSPTEVVVYFDKELDEASAEDVANYSIDGDIGSPKEASYDSDDNTVTLTTEEMDTNSSYTLTVNGVKDVADNVLTDVEADFLVSADSNDIDAPEIQDVEGVNKWVVRVTFDEPIDVSTPPTLTLDTNLLADGVDADGIKTNDQDITGTYVVSTDDDDKVLEFNFDPAVGGNVPGFTGFTDKDAMVVACDAQDLAGNVNEDDSYDVALSGDAPDKVELVSWDQTTSRQFKLQFSEKVEPKVAQVTADGYTFDVSTDDDDATIGYLDATKVMDADDTVNLNLTALFQNFHEQAVKDEADLSNDASKTTAFEAGIDDTDAPYIDSVVATDRRHIDVTFSENMSYEGSYEINYVNSDGDDDSITVSSVSDPDDNVVTLTLGEDLESKYVYTLVVDNQARDISGNKVEKDAEFDFAGTDVVAIGNYILGVELLNGTTFSLQTNDTLNAASTVTVTYEVDDTTYTVPTSTVAVGASNGKADEFKVTIDKDAGVFEGAFADGVTYTATTSDGSYTFDFDGMVDNDVVVDFNAHAAGAGDDTYDVTYDDMKNGDVVAFCDPDDGTVIIQAPVASLSASQLVSAVAGTHATIVVMRGNVVLYYANNYELPTE